MAIRLTGIASGLDTDSMVQELVSAYSLKKENYEKEKTKLEWKQETWKELNSNIYKFYTSNLSNLRRVSSFTNKKTCNVSDTTKATVTANNKVPNGTQTIEIQKLAKASYLTSARLTKASGDEIKDVTTTLAEVGVTGNSTIKVQTAEGTKEFTVNATETIEQFVSRFKEETGVNVAFDNDQKRLIFSTESGLANNFDFVVEDENDLNTLAAMGLATAEQYTAMGQEVPEHYAYKQDGSDAVIVVNGATYESASNTLSVNGLTITAMGQTTGAITVTTGQDTDAIYDMVRDFFTEYNNLINTMTENYNAASSKGYEPLTDDEKEAMSETEIEKWEKKIKDSLLRRDGTLNSVMNAMISSMSRGVEIDGKKYYLSNFGIETLGFLNAEANKQNAYHIDGDEKDSVSADAEDKLRAAIEKDPELVSSFFTQLATNLYDTLTTKMSSNKSLSSAYTIYNDKQMKDEMEDLEDTIAEWEDKVADYEDYWYDKFSEMETALSKLQNQTSQLTSLLGN